MSNIENFKNEILFQEIHRAERSDKLRDKIEIVERVVRSNKKETSRKESWIVPDEIGTYEFEIIASQILYQEKLIILIDELVKSNYDTVEFNPYYYKGIFTQRIKEAKAVLRKLRPYILEETKGYSIERKQKDLNSDIARFYKGWYF